MGNYKNINIKLIEYFLNSKIYPLVFTGKGYLLVSQLVNILKLYLSSDNYFRRVLKFLK